jgi:cytochrome b
VLVALGTALLNAKALGVPSEGKILLKQWHVWAGYVLLANLSWRILWGFIGSPTSRWKNILPFTRGFVTQLKADIAARRIGKPPVYAGHNPLARLMVTALFGLLIVQVSSGLILAATDLYQGPLGGWVASSVAAEGVDPGSLKPYDKTGVDADSYDAMRALRGPVIETHEWIFFILLGLVGVHIAAVVLAEIKEGGGLVSAMISGKKALSEEPVDKF